ncbi:aminomethyltransferase [Clostridia bacterium]|nr:aminomethyltransferase [Clostridia bacterium]
MERTTELYNRHIEAGARMASFAGYMMPIQYPTGIIAEHTAVRTAAGLFDVSHMGEILVDGTQAQTFLQYLACNDISDLDARGCRYTPLLNENGGVVDDVIIARLGETLYAVVANASNIAKDLSWMRSHRLGGTALLDISGGISSMALQGPLAESILLRLMDSDELPARYYTFTQWVSVADAAAFVCRTGYTGEDGFEIYVSNHDAGLVWDAILDAGCDDGLIPCGLGARDTLRLEAAMPLYGHELTDSITPLEAGLNRFTKMDKDDFTGKSALEAAGPPRRRRIGLRMIGRGIAREGCTVYSGDRQVGYVTSGTQLPTVGYAGAMALVDADIRAIGAKLEVDIRGKRVAAEIVRLPFYKRAK